MTNTIDVKKVASLSRLKLAKEEEAYFEEKFESILNYVSKIAEVKIESDMREKDESNQRVYRQDTVINSDVSPEQFSETIENLFFKVPKVIEND